MSNSKGSNISLLVLALLVCVLLAFMNPKNLYYNAARQTCELPEENRIIKLYQNAKEAYLETPQTHP